MSSSIIRAGCDEAMRAMRACVRPQLRVAWQCTQCLPFVFAYSSASRDRARTSELQEHRRSRVTGAHGTAHCLEQRLCSPEKTNLYR